MCLEKIFCKRVQKESDEWRTKSLACATALGNCQRERDGAKRALETANEELNRQRAKVEKLEERLNEPSEEEKLWEEYWNSKYPKKVIKYSGRVFPSNPKSSYSIDVRYFFTCSRPLIELVESNKLNTGSYDERALKCLKWVRANIKYASDQSTFGAGEYWSFPPETLYTKKGDCDSGAILLANLMMAAKVPYWRIRLNAGSVKGGGHAYVTYCRESDNKFVVMDWCYWYNSKQPADRKLHSEKKDYYGIWFSWNRQFAFGKMQTMKGKPREFKVGK